VISIFMLITVFMYFVLKFKYMLFKEEWSLIQQTVVSDLEDLQV